MDNKTHDADNNAAAARLAEKHFAAGFICYAD